MFYWVYDISRAGSCFPVCSDVRGFVLAGHDPSQSHPGPLVSRQGATQRSSRRLSPYFGVIYGLLLGLLAVATYQNHTMLRRRSQARLHRLQRFIGISAPIPNLIARNLRHSSESIPFDNEDAWPLQRKGMTWKVNRAACCMQGWLWSNRRPRGTRPYMMRRSDNLMIFLKHVGAPFLCDGRDPTNHVVHGGGWSLDQHVPDLDV